MKKYFPLIVFVFILISCNTTNYLKGKRIDSTVITCITDSTAFFDSDFIKLTLKLGDNNSQCPNKPAFSFPYEDWPTHVSLWLDDKIWYLSTNKTFIPNENGQMEKIAYKLKYGPMQYDARKKILTLSLPELNWTQKYKFAHFAADSLITLTKLK